jgi:hypothetical protein
MFAKHRAFLLIAALSAIMFLTACPKQESISKIKADPSRYSDKEVGIVGTVTNSYGVWNKGAYEVDDGTGRLWVISRNKGVPSRGARVGVKGRVYTGFNFDGQTFGLVMEESDRRVKDR